MIAEVKANNETNDPVVLEKARAATAWTSHANEFVDSVGGKRWRYAMVRDSDITESATFAGLLARSA